MRKQVELSKYNLFAEVFIHYVEQFISYSELK